MEIPLLLYYSRLLECSVRYKYHLLGHHRLCDTSTTLRGEILQRGTHDCIRTRWLGGRCLFGGGGKGGNPGFSETLSINSILA